MARRYLTADPRTDHIQQLRMMMARELSFQSQMRAELRRVVREVAQDVARGGQGIAAMDAHERRTGILFRAQYTSIFQTFGGRIIDAAGKSGRAVRETKDTQGIFERLLSDYITTWAARKVRLVTDTTKAQIRKSLNIGQAEGLGTDALARKLRKDLGGTITQLRAHVIARTEVHSTANAANDAAIDSLGINSSEMSKEWVSAKDERTRPDHAAADGQTRDRSEPFNVGGASLMYPGDPSGPADQVIMCRCTQVFSFNY